MKHFTDRIFYLRTDELAHISFLTSGMWVLYILSEKFEWNWMVQEIADTYEELMAEITYKDPVLLLHEEWA